MPTPTGVATSSLACVLAFDGNSRLAVRIQGSSFGIAFEGADLPAAAAGLDASFRGRPAPVGRFRAVSEGRSYRVFLCRVEGAPADPQVEFQPIGRLESD